MEKRTLVHLGTLLGFIAAACVLAALTTRGELDPALPVPGQLPEKVGRYQGAQVLYCHERECLTSMPQPSGTLTRTCPECGGEMATLALAEKQLLPSDTRIARRLYTEPSGRHQYTVSIVTGGYERRSIHKPQVCLVAQGNVITRQYSTAIALREDRLADLTIMEMNSGAYIFAYWFTDGTRETASHLKRLFWIAWDGVRHNTRRRWAYISFITNARLPPDRVEFDRFVRDVHDALSQRDAPST